MALKFTALSGTISVTENLYVYETEKEMFILDCGVGFPDLEMHGVDLVIPDFSYIIKNKHKLKGVLLSQGHEDHIGALPFLLKEVKTEVWAAPLVSEFLKDKFKDHGIKGVKVNVFDPDTASFNIGSFRVHSFRVTHSIPDACGFAIDTPEGRIFHVPEHKMDQKPVDEKPFNIQRAKELANQKILFLASDCIGSNKPGFSKGEEEIERNLLNIANKAKNCLFFTAISSNIGRFQQAINVAEKTNRKAVLVGRSIQRKCEIAHQLGYLKYKKNTVLSLRESEGHPRNKLMYIVSGCYGQIGSSLYRLSSNEHDRIHVEKGDMMIFSANPAPPYTKESQNYIIDNLTALGVDVHYYEHNEGLYSSGHGTQEDIKALYKITNPTYFIPIGGTIRYMFAYKKLAIEFGASEDRVFQFKPGDYVEFENGKKKNTGNIPVKEVLVDGLGIGDVGNVVLRDRQTLSKDGMVVVLVKIDKSGNRLIETPEIISRGFVYHGGEKEFLVSTSKELQKRIEKKKKVNKHNAKAVTIEFLERYFFNKIRRRPMILPVVVEA